MKKLLGSASHNLQMAHLQIDVMDRVATSSLDGHPTVASMIAILALGYPGYIWGDLLSPSESTTVGDKRSSKHVQPTHLKLNVGSQEVISLLVSQEILFARFQPFHS